MQAVSEYQGKRPNKGTIYNLNPYDSDSIRVITIKV